MIDLNTKKANDAESKFENLHFLLLTLISKNLINRGKET